MCLKIELDIKTQHSGVILRDMNVELWKHINARIFLSLVFGHDDLEVNIRNIVFVLNTLPD